MIRCEKIIQGIDNITMHADPEMHVICFWESSLREPSVPPHRPIRTQHWEVRRVTLSLSAVSLSSVASPGVRKSSRVCLCRCSCSCFSRISLPTPCAPSNSQIHKCLFFPFPFLIITVFFSPRFFGSPACSSQGFHAVSSSVKTRPTGTIRYAAPS